MEKANNVGRVSGGLEHEAELWHDLKVLLKRNGGKHDLLACGGVFSGPFQTQMVAYELGIHGIQIGWRGTPPPARDEAHRRPLSAHRPLRKVAASHRPAPRQDRLPEGKPCGAHRPPG